MIDTVDKPRRTPKTSMSRDEMHEMVDEILEEKGLPTDGDALAELAARGRMGLASIEDEAAPEPEARTVDVTAYGPDGESIVVTQAIPYTPPPAPEASNTPAAGNTVQVALPGFPAETKVDKVILSFGGTIELDRTVESHRTLLASMKWKEEVELSITAKVRDSALQERSDDRYHAALKVTSARLVEPEPPFNSSAFDDCDRCGGGPPVDGLYCAGCIAEMDAEDAAGFDGTLCMQCKEKPRGDTVLCADCFEAYDTEASATEDDTASVASALNEAIADALAAEAAE